MLDTAASTHVICHIQVTRDPLQNAPLYEKKEEEEKKIAARYDLSVEKQKLLRTFFFFFGALIVDENIAAWL